MSINTITYAWGIKTCSADVFPSKLFVYESEARSALIDLNNGYSNLDYVIVKIDPPITWRKVIEYLPKEQNYVEIGVDTTCTEQPQK